jgi:hypothetical protein
LTYVRKVWTQSLLRIMVVHNYYWE